jgi:hypothetical protein
MELVRCPLVTFQSLRIAFLHYFHEVADLLVVRELHDVEQLDLAVIKAQSIVFFLGCMTFALLGRLPKLFRELDELTIMCLQLDIMYLVIEVVLDFLFIQLIFHLLLLLFLLRL